MENVIDLEVENRLLKKSHELMIVGFEQLNLALNKAVNDGNSIDYAYWASATKKIIDNAKNIIK